LPIKCSYANIFHPTFLWQDAIVAYTLESTMQHNTKISAEILSLKKLLVATHEITSSQYTNNYN